MTFDHVAIASDDIAASVSFYQQMFPWTEIIDQDATWAIIDCRGTKIAFVTPAEHPPHVAFSVESEEELIAEAEKMGGTIKIHRDRSRSFYTSDPAGNAIEIVWYPSVEDE
jgi:catechol 2,3-dioxygenase-like lactoylglutathione lyase family enzyme